MFLAKRPILSQVSSLPVPPERSSDSVFDVGVWSLGPGLPLAPLPSHRSPLSALPPSPLSSSCPYLHRTAGDTERRYHLRYYKTSTCVYETDARGYCVKNGPHCAFAHRPHDLRYTERGTEGEREREIPPLPLPLPRSPVYDIRELAGVEDETGAMVSSLEREKGVLVDDLRWQGQSSDSLGQSEC